MMSLMWPTTVLCMQVHYKSSDLKHWTYNQTVRSNSFAYDSDVFRLADGRYILFSTGQTREVR